MFSTGTGTGIQSNIRQVKFDTGIRPVNRISKKPKKSRHMSCIYLIGLCEGTGASIGPGVP
jgi:hypothetical protein